MRCFQPLDSVGQRASEGSGTLKKAYRLPLLTAIVEQEKGFIRHLIPSGPSRCTKTMQTVQWDRVGRTW